METAPLMFLRSFLRLSGSNPRVLIDIDRVPTHMQQGYRTRNYTVAHGKMLCDQCSGTGHEYEPFYREGACLVCDGRGRSDGKHMRITLPVECYPETV
ncbi:hypothetical protein ACFLZM_05925 [Thermodesulfobacteriota bacterium]